ncbi:hypothetical protein TKK_0001107 [Trichogramma kaykai]|uniref:DNA primase n=1 Tax=Trichogramma kaykai TaxID=54128 RepID=A0ABD2WTZ6_9HYME
MTELTGERSLSPFLALYYSRVFPYDDFCGWLSYNRHVSFPNREFVFDCGIEGTHEHLSFSDAVALKNKLRRLRPDKIEVGAVFSAPPRHIGNLPVEKEFVLDIDLANYNHVRHCCAGNNEREVCHDCYKLLTLGMRIIDRSLRIEHGFNHILWVYHTRHMYAWVCDKKARYLPNSYRQELINRLQHSHFFRSMKAKGRSFNSGLLSESIQRALSDIRPRFQQILMQQNLFEDAPNKMSHLMCIMPNLTVGRDVHSLIRSLEGRDSCEKFTELTKMIRSKVEMGIPEWVNHSRLMDEILIWYAYPRMNQNVSISMCLPLIAPFTTKSNTGEIAIPIDIDWAKDMNPVNAPTIERVMEEVELAIRNGHEVEVDTCLKPFLKIFREFLTNLFNSNDQQEDLPNNINYQEPNVDPPSNNQPKSTDMRACHQQ